MSLNAPASTRMVAATLANFRDWTRASNDRLAEMCNLSPRTVKRAIAWLEKRGYLERRGPPRFRQLRARLPAYERIDDDRRWIPAEILRLRETAEFRLWLSFVAAHSESSVIDLSDEDTGYPTGGVVLSDTAIAKRLNISRQAATKIRQRAIESGLIESTLGTLTKGGYRVALPYDTSTVPISYEYDTDITTDANGRHWQHGA